MDSMHIGMQARNFKAIVLELVEDKICRTLALQEQDMEPIKGVI